MRSQRSAMSRGENVAIVEYYAVGDTSRYPSLAAEIVGLAPDAIVATIGGAAALREVTQTIPIVLRAGNIAELLQNGLIESVGRPGGSVTGIVSADAGDRIQKRAEVAHDIVPGARRFALVIEATQARREFFEENSFAAAAKQGVDMFVVDFGGPEDCGAVFETLAREGAEVAVVAGSAIIATNGLTSLPGPWPPGCRRCTRRAAVLRMDWRRSPRTSPRARALPRCMWPKS